MAAFGPAHSGCVRGRVVALCRACQQKVRKRYAAEEFESIHE